MLQPPIIWNECKRQTSHFVSVIIQLFTCLCSSCCAWVCLYSTYFFVQGPKITIVSRSDYDLCSYFKCDSLFRNCTDAYRHTRTHTPTAHYHKNKHIYVLIKEDCEKQELMMQATIFIWSEHLSNWHGPCRESEEMKIKREREKCVSCESVWCYFLLYPIKFSTSQRLRWQAYGTMLCSLSHAKNAKLDSRMDCVSPCDTKATCVRTQKGLW